LKVESQKSAATGFDFILSDIIGGQVAAQNLHLPRRAGI
jgi:hypothetical protein